MNLFWTIILCCAAVGVVIDVVGWWALKRRYRRKADQ